jgi:MerR family transcriptional regulator, light-induced transcriptional regulator
MVAPASTAAADLGAGPAIQQVARLLGVPAPTLRSWERRYGLPTTARSQGGHRRYSAEALTELRLMRDAIARGQRAADAARSVRLLLDRSAPAIGRVTEMIVAAQQMDAPEVGAVLDRANAAIGTAATIEEVLLPAMRQIGTLWETGHCDVGQEHLATGAARGWLSRLVHAAPAPTRSGALVLACGPRELHTLGLEALALLLAYEGHGCRVLGAQTPQEALVAAVALTGAAGVVVVSHLATRRRPAVEAICAVAATGCTVFYAGNAFRSPFSRKAVPGLYLGENLPFAAALIGTALDG